jgi:hypothetical protein
MIDDIRPTKPKVGHRVPLKTLLTESDDHSEAHHDHEKSFKTPEEVAASDVAKPTEIDLPPPEAKAFEKPKPKSRWQAIIQWRPTRKQWLIIGVVLLVLIGTGTTLALTYHRKAAPVAVVTKPAPVKPKPAAAPATVASRLTGVQVSPALASLPVTGVMIENSDDARPQSGLSQAGVIFEALAEGGITRFLVLYEEGQPTSIGPVRSARPYFIDWLLPFDAAYAHVGGSPDALSEITSLNVKDMNEFYYGSTYTRISSREAPHNVYTSMSNLLSLEQSKGWTSSNFTGFPRKADSPSKSPTTTDINFNMSSSDMAVNYQYDPTLNSYKRSEGGAPMIDANTNQQLEPKVVIAIVVPWTDGPLDASGAYYTDYSDIGSGTAYVFQDGTVTQGVWDKSSQSSQIQFNTTAGAPIKLNAGQTWISVVGSAGEVSYN